MLLVPLLVAALLPSAAADSWNLAREYHYSVKIKGAVAGVMALRMYKDEEGKLFRTVEEMEAEVDRGNDKVLLRFKTEIEEDVTGRVRRAGYKQKMATQEIEMQYDYVTRPGVVGVTSIQGGQTHKSEAPPPKEHVGRVGMLRNIESALKSDTKKLTFRTMKPEMGPAAVDVVSATVATDTESIRGLADAARDVSVSKWNTKVTGISLESTEWYYIDDKGDGLPTPVMVHYSVDSPLGKLESNLDLEASAKQAMDDAENRPELVHSAFIDLEAPVKRLWEGKGSVSYKVTTKSGESAPLPSEGYQTVDGDVVTINMDEAEVVEAPSAEYMANTAMIDGSDEEVVKLAKLVISRATQAYYGPPSPGTLAKGAWAETRRTIKLSNLATGFASASETARTKTGDCSEHAVLLAAILRALGIPSRACSGLVYLEGHGGRAHFGWHMWTQALITEGGPNSEPVYRWHDLDATLPVPFSLGHILLGTSAMTDAEAHTAELKLVSLIGNLHVTVL